MYRTLKRGFQLLNTTLCRLSSVISALHVAHTCMLVENRSGVVKATNAVSKPASTQRHCKCGSNTHMRPTHKECPLYGTPAARSRGPRSRLECSKRMQLQTQHNHNQKPLGEQQFEPPSPTMVITVAPPSRNRKRRPPPMPMGDEFNDCTQTILAGHPSPPAGKLVRRGY